MSFLYRFLKNFVKALVAVALFVIGCRASYVFLDYLYSKGVPLWVFLTALLVILAIVFALAITSFQLHLEKNSLKKYGIIPSKTFK